MEKDDPSEYERFKKLLDNGKAKFKPKAAGETPANPDTQAKAPEAPVKAEEKPAAKPKEDAARAPEKAPAAPAE